MLAEVPAIIGDKGRVAGFEHLRDRLLSDWETFIARGVNAYSALKLVIEMDRHAMFAEVQARKQQGQFDQQLYADFQDYLHGEPNADPPNTSSADADSTDLTAFGPGTLDSEGTLGEDDDSGEDEDRE